METEDPENFLAAGERRLELARKAEQAGELMTLFGEGFLI